MGLKGAAAYFQRVLATIVLAGLMYITCELYIDDVLVFGRTPDLLVYNLRQVFTRFRKYRITLNPRKCRFGMSRVEYVGHIISEEGISFTTEKREKVLNFPRSERQKGMKQFIGLANYFRDHVKNLSIVMAPLQKLVDKYDKRKAIAWTPELETIFYQVQEQVGQCPQLYFPDENAPITVHQITALAHISFKR